MIRVENWKKNIYLGPESHWLHIGDEYKMQHDVYSLGVILLEIALWTLLINPGGDATRHLWKNAELKLPVALKKTFIAMEEQYIPPRLSHKYTDVVVACLTGLEEEEKQGSYIRRP
jgi:hypothetical protein